MSKITKKIIVNSLGRETRVAVVENDLLIEIYMQRPEAERTVGNVYKGRVIDVVPGIQAAFVNIGLERNAFLFIKDVVSDKANNLPIEKILREGQEILVQVSREAYANKGARVSMDINLPGRYLVLMPMSKHVGISRKLADGDVKDNLRLLANNLIDKDKLGMILRTAAATVDQEQLLQDYYELTELWYEILDNYKQQKKLGIVHQELDIIPRLIRDALSNDVKEIIVDSYNDLRSLNIMLIDTAPELKIGITQYKGNQPIFDHYNIETQLERAIKSRVWLPGGGYIIIDHTEALTVIDVNTGKYTGSDNLEETIFTTNKQAAIEVARQLRLRNISGIIIVDFIDMHLETNQNQVLEILEKAFRHDKNRTFLMGITKLGLVEITRKKMRKSLSERILEECTNCYGYGKVLTTEAVANKLDREMRHYLQKSKDEAFVIELHPRLLESFLGDNKQNLQNIIKHTSKNLYFRENKNMSTQYWNIIFTGDDKTAQQVARIHENNS